jgi:peptide/nickel transport system permease protein
MVIIFAIWLDLFPAQGMSSLMADVGFFEGWLDFMHHMILPATALSFFNMAMVTRLSRASMLNVLREDYITTAWSKGLTESAVMYKHALRNAILPVITIIGVNIRFLLAGSVLTETVFAWPGIGRLIWEGIYKRDYPILTGIFVLVSIFVISAQLVVDVAYAYLDPRIRYR